jgi:microcystin-dependent protein
MATLSSFSTAISFDVGDTVWSAIAPGVDWFECNGQVLLQSAYPSLFSVLGLIEDVAPGVYSYNPATEFVLPVTKSLTLSREQTSKIFIKAK